ncbi:hypothetical protein SK983_003026 [Vibrio vulnificus]|nr:hypothetical protein [Vibrio vulnificus]
MFSEIKQFSEKLESLKGGSGSCIRSAMYHVEKAEVLSGVDPEMSVFRLITAEEEAATAILLMLKEHGYEGAKELNKNNHLHKQCLYPYICSIIELLKLDLRKVSNHPPILEWVDVDGMDAIKLGIRVTIEDQNLIMEMNPPLNFRVSRNEELHDFSHELVVFLERKGFNDTVKHLKENANLRNKLLYSDGKTIPNTLADTDNGKYEKLGQYLLQKVNVLIAIYFMTAPYKKMDKAHFLEQALHSYLKVLKHIKGQRL